MTEHSNDKYPPLPSFEDLGLPLPRYLDKKNKKARMAKKFRFQLLCDWICHKFQPCSVADIGGGKGLLAHMLNQKGFSAVVIDPFDSAAPVKYKDIHSKERVKLDSDISIPRINAEFKEELASDFDLLVGLHAHGSNIRIINAAAKYHKNFVILPCCVIDEPIIPPTTQSWFLFLSDYAKEKDFNIEYFYLDFKGQSIGICGTVKE